MVRESMDKKILIVRSAFLGDFVVVFPQLKVFMQENALSLGNISFLIFNKENANPSNVLFGKDTLISKHTHVIKNSGIFNTILSLFKARKELGNFDEIIYLNYTIENFKLKFFKTFFLKLLWPTSKKSGFKIKDKYSQFQYISPFGNIDISNIHQTNLADWFLQFTEKAGVIKLKVAEIVNTLTPNLIIGIYCHGKMAAKIWPMAFYISTIQELSKNYTATFLLIGAKEDRDYNEEVQTLLNKKGISQVINKAGELSIAETIELMKHFSVFITNDGLPMHLAGIANCPTVALYTYRENIGAWDPFFNDQFISIRTNVTCKECYKPYCSNPVCITSTSPISVISSVSELMQTKSKIKKSVILYPENAFLNYLNVNAT